MVAWLVKIDRSRTVDQNQAFSSREKSGIMQPFIRKILVVDDDPGMLRLLVKWLSGFGYDVRAADDGRRAAELITGETPDMVITDWEMPNMNGLQLIQWIRSLPLPHYIYTVALTIRCGKSDIVALFEAGIDDYLKKPVDKDELLARLLCGAKLTRLMARLKTPVVDVGIADTSLDLIVPVADRYSGQTVREHMEVPDLVMNAGHPLRWATQAVLNSACSEWPVVEPDGKFVGLLHEADLLAGLLQEKAWDKPLRLFARKEQPDFSDTSAALEVYGHFCRSAASCVAIVRDGVLKGIVRRRAFLSHLGSPAVALPAHAPPFPESAFQETNRFTTVLKP